RIRIHCDPISKRSCNETARLHDQGLPDTTMASAKKAQRYGLTRSPAEGSTTAPRVRGLVPSGRADTLGSTIGCTIRPESNPIARLNRGETTRDSGASARSDTESAGNGGGLGAGSADAAAAPCSASAPVCVTSARLAEPTAIGLELRKKAVTMHAAHKRR